MRGEFLRDGRVPAVDRLNLCILVCLKSGLITSAFFIRAELPSLRKTPSVDHALLVSSRANASTRNLNFAPV